MAGARAIDGRVPCLAIAVVLPSAAALTAATAVVPRSSRRPTLGRGANSCAPSVHVSGVTVSKLVAIGVRYHATRAVRARLLVEVTLRSHS